MWEEIIDDLDDRNILATKVFRKKQQNNKTLLTVTFDYKLIIKDEANKKIYHLKGALQKLFCNKTVDLSLQPHNKPNRKPKFLKRSGDHLTKE